MKREIKFRAKDANNGEWVYGYFFKSWDNCYILHGTVNGVPVMVEVTPETIGQFTGLKDKNGVEIYEGDIVEFTRAQCRGAYRGSRMAVSYQTYVFCGFGFDKTMALTKKRANECNIIGNIHDNPELLK